MGGSYRSTLLQDGKIILRLRSTDPEDHNFVHASYLFVTGSLLPRAKRYLSARQKEAVDLFVTSKLLKEEKPHVVGFFLDEYLHPKLAQPQSRLGALLNDFEIVDENGLFSRYSFRNLNSSAIKFLDVGKIQ